jgi:hypothetical protein
MCINKHFYPLESSEIAFATGILRLNVQHGKRIEAAFYSIESLVL